MLFQALIGEESLKTTAIVVTVFTVLLHSFLGEVGAVAQPLTAVLDHQHIGVVR